MATSALSARIQGLREAKAAFQRLPDVVRDRMLAATETTVREIARAAQARLQASPSIRTRALFNAVAWRVTKTNGRGRVGIAKGSIVTPGKNGSASTAEGASVVTPSRYAHLVEFGARQMPAEPFMLPAADSQRLSYLDRCRAAGRDIERDMSVSRTV